MLDRNQAIVAGDMPDDERDQVRKVIIELDQILLDTKVPLDPGTAAVRGRMQCSLVVLRDADSLHVVAQRHPGFTDQFFYSNPGVRATPAQIQDLARWEFGYEDPFFLHIPAMVLSQQTITRRPTLEAIAAQHVASELARARRLRSLITVSPIFGPAEFVQEDKQVFVLMPFETDLDEVYSGIMKPTVEGLGLVCRRADEIRSVKAVMQDIWKAICEARVVIGDITQLNPNVMYELGIAHTLGKDTILIYQESRQASQRIPFDLYHIRQIRYENTALGGQKLAKELRETLQSVVSTPRIK